MELTRSTIAMFKVVMHPAPGMRVDSHSATPQLLRMQMGSASHSIV